MCASSPIWPMAGSYGSWSRASSPPSAGTGSAARTKSPNQPLSVKSCRRIPPPSARLRQPCLRQLTLSGRGIRRVPAAPALRGRTSAARVLAPPRQPRQELREEVERSFAPRHSSRPPQSAHRRSSSESMSAASSPRADRLAPSQWRRCGKCWGAADAAPRTPRSCSGLQRRAGAPPPAPGLHEDLRQELVQAIAAVRPPHRCSWCEPPVTGALHLSTLVRASVLVIAQHGGARADQLWSALCQSGPFALDRQKFGRFLRGLAAEDVIQQAGDGDLILGVRGERDRQPLQLLFGFHDAAGVPLDRRWGGVGHAPGHLCLKRGQPPDLCWQTLVDPVDRPGAQGDHRQALRSRPSADLRRRRLRDPRRRSRENARRLRR